MPFVNKFKILVCTACLMLVGQAFAGNCAADYVPPENPVWDGSTKTEPCTKDGFYIIDNAAKLAWYAAYGSDNKGNFTRGNAKLTADIDLGGKLWTPIAAGKGGATEYTKTFDGNGHVVYNLYIKASELAQINKEYVQNLGFVGVLGGGTIKNLILENVNIQAATNAGSVNGLTTDNQISVGAVVGWMSEKGSSRVDTCMASGTIRTTGNGQGVGGIVGNAKKGTISNCLSLVEIHTSGSDSYVGGVIGITKTDVTVSSCVYAGPGLTNTGAEGLTGGIAGNVFTGKLTTNDNYFEGTGINGVGGTICKSKKGECTKENAESAANSIANADAQNVNETNADNVACALNGTNGDGSCKEEPWSVGQTGLSLNGYGADGYKIIFNANGGAFAGSAVTKNIYLASGMAITDNEVGKPSRNGFSFEGWAATADANESLQNLGNVSKSAKFYAVWALLDTIKFNVAPGSFSDGDVEKTKLVAKGEIITVEGLGDLPAARCKTYASENECKTWSYFTGWALTEGGSESDTVSLDTVIAEQGKILYAVWTDVETYTVTYNANHHGRTTVDYVRVGDGESVEEPDEPIADDGYEFVGWFTDEAGNSSYSFSAEIHENIILYAKWSLKHFDITYVMNNVGSKGENPDKYTIDTAFVLKAPADVEGYVFEGWFYDASFTNKATQVIQGTTGDKTFYAKWSKKQYRIMYLADNSSQGAITDQFKEHGLPITLASAGHFNRKGYGAQIGWATVAEGVKVYDFETVYENDAPLTLYPAWGSPIEYTITYVCDVCTGDNPDKPNPHTYTVNDTKGINLPIYNPTYPNNYDFKGWYWDKAYKKRTTNIPMDTVGNLTLYGKTLKFYYLAYELYGSTKANNPEKYTIEQTFTLKDPAPRAGYTFGGWYTEDTFVNQITEIQLGSSEDMTLHAKWIPNTYTVSYDAGGFGEGSIENGTKTHDVDFVLSSETFTRAGYTQDGWENVNGDVVSSPYTENADITLYPHWVEKVYPFLVNDFGAIKVYEDENGKLTAEIDGMSTGEVSTISPEDNILVSSVNFNREFPVNETDADKMYSTVVLPFTIAKNKVPAAVFYELKSVDVANAAVEFWTAGETLQANTPYIIRTEAATLTFNLDEGETVALNTSELNNSNSEDGLWEFRGTYSYRKWQEGDADIGRAYGFRGNARESYAIGSFARIGAGAAIRPFRAYLLKKNVQQGNRLAFPLKKSSTSLDRASIDEDSVPGTLDVVIVERETGETTAIGTLDTRTGEIKFIDSWFDMKGRRLNAKPTTKGIYYYNGKRVIVR